MHAYMHITSLYTCTHNNDNNNIQQHMFKCM